MKGYWKVPFRAVYCDSFVTMLKQTLWCHVVIKVFPNVVDFDFAPQDRQEFLKQYEFMFRRAAWTKLLKDSSAGPAEQIRAQLALREFETPRYTPDWQPGWKPVDNSDLNKLLKEATLS